MVILTNRSIYSKTLIRVWKTIQVKKFNLNKCTYLTHIHPHRYLVTVAVPLPVVLMMHSLHHSTCYDPYEELFCHWRTSCHSKCIPCIIHNIILIYNTHTNIYQDAQTLVSNHLSRVPFQMHTVYPSTLVFAVRNSVMCQIFFSS